MNDLLQTLDKSKVTTIEDFLPLLPEELRANYTLFRKSDSLQRASDLYPRVIMYDRSLNLYVSFNGAPSEEGNGGGLSTVETIQYRPKKKSFEFREIEFDPSGIKLPKVSEINPPQCAVCHSQQYTPLFNGALNFWPNAYGQDEDQIGLDPTETIPFNNFKSLASKHPRYKALVLNDPVVSKNIEYPFMSFSSDPTQPLPFPNTARYQRNTFISWALTIKGAEHLAQKVKEDHNYKATKYMVNYVSICNNLETHDPQFLTFYYNLFQPHLNPNFPKEFMFDELLYFGLSDKETSISAEDENFIPFFTFNTVNNWTGAFSYDQIVREFLFDDLRHSDGVAESMTFFDPAAITQAKADPFYLGESQIIDSLEYLYRSAQFVNGKEKVCLYLKEKAWDQLQDLSSKQINSFGKTWQEMNSTDAKKVLTERQCIECHTLNGKLANFGPMIPWDDELALKQYIANRPEFIGLVKSKIDPDYEGFGHRMPMASKSLTVAEQTALLSYLNSLVAPNK